MYQRSTTIKLKDRKRDNDDVIVWVAESTGDRKYDLILRNLPNRVPSNAYR